MTKKGLWLNIFATTSNLFEMLPKIAKFQSEFIFADLVSLDDEA